MMWSLAFSSKVQIHQHLGKALRIRRHWVWVTFIQSVKTQPNIFFTPPWSVLLMCFHLAKIDDAVSIQHPHRSHAFWRFFLPHTPTVWLRVKSADTGAGKVISAVFKVRRYQPSSTLPGCPENSTQVSGPKPPALRPFCHRFKTEGCVVTARSGAARFNRFLVSAEALPSQIVPIRQAGWFRAQWLQNLLSSACNFRRVLLLICLIASPLLFQHWIGYFSTYSIDSIIMLFQRQIFVPI